VRIRKHEFEWPEDTRHVKIFRVSRIDFAANIGWSLEDVGLCLAAANYDPSFEVHYLMVSIDHYDYICSSDKFALIPLPHSKADTASILPVIHFKIVADQLEEKDEVHRPAGGEK
jgi:hypothetical protein